MSAALLQVGHHQLENRPVLKVYDSNPKEIEVQICGYYLYSEEKKRSLDTIEGVLGKQKFRENPKGKRAVVWELNIQDNGRLKHGYSGSPVVDKKSGKVIGMVTNMGRKIKEGDVGEIISVATLKQIHLPIWEKISPSISIGEVVEPLPDIKTPVSLPDDIKKRQGVEKLANIRQEEVKVFISYPREEEKIVEELKRILKNYKVELWMYTDNKNVAFGEEKLSINNRVKNSIQESDYFLILLTRTTKYSQEVSQQLGLAFDLQKQNNNTLPQIRAINYDNLDQNSQIISIKDFETEEEKGKLYFKNNINYDFVLMGNQVDHEKIEKIVKELRPQVTFIRDVEQDKEKRLLKSSYELCKQLFPFEERDDLETITDWLYSSHSSHSDFPGELYAVLHLGEQAIGMAYASCYKEKAWCYVPYFGIERTYRQRGRANWLFEELQKEIKQIKPDTKGIVAEVQSIDFSLLEKAGQKDKILQGTKEDEKILHNLRAARRLELFQREGALTIVYKEGVPFPYKQPALREPLISENERDYFLIVYLFEKQLQEKIEGEEIVDFIYDIYQKDYAEDTLYPIKGYEEYIQSLKKSLKTLAKKGLKLQRFILPSFIRKLRNRLKEEGIDEEKLKL